MTENLNSTPESPHRWHNTVAAAVVLVILLAAASAFLLRPPALAPAPSDSAASATPMATEVASPSVMVTPSASAAVSATPTASVSSPQPEEGAYGPTWQQPAGEAFFDPEFCENQDAIDTVGQPTGVHYRVAMPSDWYTNQASEGYGACLLFSPQEIEDTDDGSLPAGVVIGFNLVPGGDFGAGGQIESQESYTVAGLPAVRYALTPAEGGFILHHTVVWIIGIEGELPAEGNASRYLAIETNEGTAGNAEQYANNIDVLDRMIATFELLDSGR